MNLKILIKLRSFFFFFTTEWWIVTEGKGLRERRSLPYTSSQIGYFVSPLCDYRRLFLYKKYCFYPFVYTFGRLSTPRRKRDWNVLQYFLNYRPRRFNRTLVLPFGFPENFYSWVTGTVTPRPFSRDFTGRRSKNIEDNELNYRNNKYGDY